PWIGDRYTPNLAGEESRQGITGGEADDNSCRDQLRAFREDHLQDARLPPAQRHADTYFVGLKRDRVCHYAEDADHNEGQSDPCKSARRDQIELRLHKERLLQESLE